jgi:hypothetical protein
VVEQLELEAESSYYCLRTASMVALALLHCHFFGLFQVNGFAVGHGTGLALFVLQQLQPFHQVDVEALS